MSSYITLDRRWFIVCPNNSGIVYTLPGSTAFEAWQNFTAAGDILGTGYTRKVAHRMGYRAKLCVISVEEKRNER